MTKNDEVVVDVRDIHKNFILPQHKNSTLKQAVVNIVKKNNKTIFKVLNGVSFQVNKGDFFGIVGRNGSGKSTLLKLIAGVYEPTKGNIYINGKLVPFIELGVGFNPELSGRDNVYLNGAMLGFTRKQMSEMYQEIVDFAEIEPFMDQKLKNYSSGMQVRLAFSIAIKAKGDILVLDEVLAVGDEAFQRKCYQYFAKLKKNKKTVILVTHSMDAVQQFCNKAVLVNEGKILLDGKPVDVAQEYRRLNNEEGVVVDGSKEPNDKTNQSKYVDLKLEPKVFSDKLILI
jgi:ABC-2 type transport system ATP-binding protein